MDVKELLDPELLPAIEAFPVFMLSNETLPSMRQPLRTPVELSDKVQRTDHQVPGDPPIPLRVHRAKDATGTLPCVYSIHGGGFVLGSYDMDDPLFDRWCPKLGIVGVSVEYRLAPEHPYPIPLEDCYAGLKWVYEHADELGVDRARIGIRGISGGGGLAAGLALLARDRGEVPIAFQLLDCP
ncbi:MAG TPA: alpha/beta hydrolase fold domain-containing protein, partial [Acidimicrobiales bacterium]